MRNSNCLTKTVAAVLLCSQLGGTLRAQQVPAPAAPAEEPAVVRTLLLRVLQGHDAVNVIRSTVMTPVVVEVRNLDDRPVEGATVSFELPAVGPGGFFPGQQLTASVRTNYQGQAAMPGFRPNSEQGRFTIKVTARLGNQIGQTAIVQTNATTFETPQPNRGIFSRKWFWISALAAAGAGTGIYFATRNGNSNANVPRISIVPGNVTIGGPR